MQSRLASLAVVGAGLLAPAVATAKTTIVFAGPPPSTNQIAGKLLPKSFAKKYNPDINAFFRRRTTVRVGDTVSFQIRGFHDIDLPGKAGTPLAFTIPGPVVSGVNDAAGNPFWFDGKLPGIGLNPLLFARSKGSTYDGSSRLLSGLVSPKPFNVTFTKAGTFTFFCDIHPGMVGTVVVKPHGSTVPTARQNTAAVAAQVTSAVKTAKVLARAKPPADTVDLGQAGPGGLELFQMFPTTLSVKAGTVVTFRMTPDSREIHTASFGPVPYLTQLAKGFRSSKLPPAAIYPSDPTQPLTATPTSHGNGFTSTGSLDSQSATKQIFPSSKIDFSTPGTYHFVCLVHPFMQGTIIVK